MKFEIKYLKKGGYRLCEKSEEYYLISLGNILLRKENEKHLSFWECMEESFNDKELEGKLFPKITDDYYDDYHFVPKRILVIQMK